MANDAMFLLRVTDPEGRDGVHAEDFAYAHDNVAPYRTVADTKLDDVHEWYLEFRTVEQRVNVRDWFREKGYTCVVYNPVPHGAVTA